VRFEVNVGDGLGGVILEGVPPLYAAAQVGDSHAAMVAVRRLLERLRVVDPETADRLKALLPAGRGTATTFRRAAVGDLAQPPRDRDTSAGLLRNVSTADAPKPVMTAEQVQVLEGLLREHRETERLAQAGLAPRSTLFLVGPPGVGKTMTAAWLARELGAPLFELEIPSLISSYLGRTGQNLREVFDFARANPAVVLLDEFDAVAKRRDDATDLGEMRRIVSVLLKEIEEWPGPSVLVAATNHPDLIDPAIFRRFQVVVRVENPGEPETAAILKLHLGPLDLSLQTLQLATKLLAGRSGSDIRDAALETRRTAALDAALTPDEAMLRSLASRARTVSERRRYVRVARVVNPRVSSARLAEMLGVSRTTAFNYLREGERHG
jgi:SpoVK/Ycf46/Vps4 family AAA+-type ATPase